METKSEQNLLGKLYKGLTPKGFELLIRDLLEKLGFDDVEVTGQPGDSGVDLIATLRKSEIPGIETNIPYKIQAKRISPDVTLNPRYIRELRGSMSSGERGVLITTAKVSPKSVEEEALKDISRLVLVIDGERLISFCQQYEVAVIKQYDVDTDYLNEVEHREKAEVKVIGDINIVATKFVTENDIRAKILRIPKDIKGKIGNARNIILYFDETTKGTYNIDKAGTYVGGVTRIFKKYSLINEDGTFLPKVSVWGDFKDGFIVKFKDMEALKAIVGSRSKNTF